MIPGASNSRPYRSLLNSCNTACRDMAGVDGLPELDTRIGMSMRRACKVFLPTCIREGESRSNYSGVGGIQRTQLSNEKSLMNKDRVQDILMRRKRNPRLPSGADRMPKSKAQLVAIENSTLQPKPMPHRPMSMNKEAEQNIKVRHSPLIQAPA